MKETASSKKTLVAQIVPVMFCFFAMGFVDLVGTATDNIKENMELSNTMAMLIPMMVFIWFFIFSVPTSLLMNKIGRKKTVLISLVITMVSLVIPIFGDSLALMLVAFSLLGIGNAIMQTSLNPLVSNLIAPDRLASTLTFGQFVKAIASFLAPIIATWGATTAMSTFGLSWKILFPIYAAVCVISVAILAATPIEEERPDKASGLVESLKMLGRPFVLLCFFGIMCHVGIDVGVNANSAALLKERLIDAGAMTPDQIDSATTAAKSAPSVYFLFRTIGCFAGAFILRYVAAKIFFCISVVMMIASMGLFFIGESQTILYIALALVGFGNSNIFPVIFSQALNSTDTEKNEVSGLMIMGLVGGAIFPFIMGPVSDALGGMNGAVIVMLALIAYLLFYTTRIKKA